MAGANDRKQYLSWDEEIKGTPAERTFEQIKAITAKWEKPSPPEEKKKEEEKKPRPKTVLQQRKEKGPVGQWGVYD